jgi:alkylation response protein AidB-like acyl-CoA dehydrogenase
MWFCAGRMLIAQGAIDACKIGVTIALRYACARPQFGGKPIMEYLTHQRRLLPALATTYAMQLQSLRLKVGRLSPAHHAKEPSLPRCSGSRYLLLKLVATIQQRMCD